MKKRVHPVDQPFLDLRASRQKEAGFPKAKWIEFCEWALEQGFRVELYEAKKGPSKYITLTQNKKRYKLRFSNHLPLKKRELKGDCDFFVGVAHMGTWTTEDAKRAVLQFFQVIPAIHQTSS